MGKLLKINQHASFMKHLKLIAFIEPSSADQREGVSDWLFASSLLWQALLYYWSTTIIATVVYAAHAL